MRMLCLLCVAGCAGETLATTSQPGIVMNGIVMNAITTNAIAANRNASAMLAKITLADAMTDPVVGVALEDPNARVFMDYLVGCALDPSQSIKWSSRDRKTVVPFDGLAGLCPEWLKDAPDTACRERVSACILARNNAFGVSVAVSLRGTASGGVPLALGEQVPPHDHVAGTNDVVESLQPCAAPATGASRDCGWSTAAVGACEPKTPVSIATGNYARCGTDWLGTPGASNNMLRVCDGTHACDDKTAIASVDDACGSSDPMADFLCPASGHYAVMVAAYDSRDAADGELASTPAIGATCEQLTCDAEVACCGTWSPACDKIAELACRYPATEAQVFRWREGSFYGDLFGSIAPGKPEVRVHPETLRVQSWNGATWIDDDGKLSDAFVGVVFPSMFACSSSNWIDGEAYVQHRVCAGPDPKDPKQYTRNCAATYVGACFDQCALLDAPPVARDYDAAGCAGDGRVFDTPITSFLAGPCDALPGYCTTVLPTPMRGW